MTKSDEILEQVEEMKEYLKDKITPTEEAGFRDEMYLIASNIELAVEKINCQFMKFEADKNDLTHELNRSKIEMEDLRNSKEVYQNQLDELEDNFNQCKLQLEESIVEGLEKYNEGYQDGAVEAREEIIA